MKLTLYTWNIQDGGGAADGRFKYVQAAHNKIVKDYDPDIIVINEHNSSLITDTKNYKHTICFNRTKVWAKCDILPFKDDKDFGIVFDYVSYKIWAALVHHTKASKDSVLTFINKHLGDFDYIAIGDFNIDSSELLDDKHFGQYFVSKSASVGRYYSDLDFWPENGVPTGFLSTESKADDNDPYPTWSNNEYSGNYDFFISNIMDGEDENEPSLKWSVHNIRVTQNSPQRASDHNPVVVILEIPRPDSNDEQ